MNTFERQQPGAIDDEAVLIPSKPFANSPRRLYCLQRREEELANSVPLAIQVTVNRLGPVRRAAWIQHGAPPTQRADRPAGVPPVVAPYRPVAETQAHWHGETGGLVGAASPVRSHKADRRRLDDR